MAKLHGDHESLTIMMITNDMTMVRMILTMMTTIVKTRIIHIKNSSKNDDNVEDRAVRPKKRAWRSSTHQQQEHIARMQNYLQELLASHPQRLTLLQQQHVETRRET